MTALCVGVVTLSDGTQVLTPEPTCASQLVVVDSKSYQALQESPAFIPMSEAPGLMLATLGLFVAAWTAKIARRALD
jgi:hypothetical protein